MYKGKRTCETLKSIRKEIADANDIPYAPRECTHQGDCRGTCPACESEMRYIENQLDLLRLVGKVVKVVCLASVVSLSACTYSNPSSTNNTEENVSCVRERLTPDPLLSSSSETKNDDEDCEEIISPIEKKAEYPGGKIALANFLSKNIVYPSSAIREEISGVVIVQFTINRDGSVSDAEVVRSIHPDLDKEALRVVKLMEKWKPAENGRGPIRSKFRLPVSFKLSD